MSLATCHGCAGVDTDGCDTCGGTGQVLNKTGFQKDVLVLWQKLFPGQNHRTVLGAAPAVIPDIIVNSDLIDAAGGIRDQQQTSACVGFTFAEVLSLLCAGLGIVRVFSAFFFYWLGRAVGLQMTGQPNTTALVDAGTEPSLVVQGLSQKGACLEAAMPSTDVSKVNDPEKSAAASDAVPRIPLVVTAFVAIEADNDNDTEIAVLQGLLPRADGTRGRAVMGAICAAPLQIADGSVVVEPSSGGIDHMIEMLDAVKIVSFDPSTMTGLLANGLTLTWSIPPVVGQYAYRWANHWGKKGHPRTDIPGTFWSSRAFMLSAAFKYLIQVDEQTIKEAA